MKPMRFRQQGATLLVALIMLVLLTLLAVTSFNLGRGSLQTVGNMQHRNEAIVAANEALAAAMSSNQFTDTPTTVFTTACNGSYNKKCVDVNGDGTSDITVELTPAPTCIQSQVIKNQTLNLANADDAGCAVGTTQTFGTAGTNSGDSLCANTLWELNAEATDNVTQAQANITQGVAVRVSTDVVAAACP